MTDAMEVRKLAVDLSAAALSVRGKAAVAIRKAAYDVQAGGQMLAPVDTGATRNSIGVDFDTSGGLTADIGPTTAYAPYLEFGTGRMSPRPFMGPAADAVLPSLEAALSQIGGNIL